MTIIDGKKYYGTHEVMEALHVAERTLFNMIEDGKIVGQKVSNRWIFSEDELKRILGLIQEGKFYSYKTRKKRVKK